MTDAAQNYAMEYVPTLRERFWRKAGFHFHLGDEPPDVDLLKGWMQTRMGVNLSWPDRLRILLTGKFRFTLTSHTDTESPSVIKNRFDWEIIAPGDKR